jgi:hypothetical protein
MKRFAILFVALVALACGGGEKISTLPLTEGGTYDLTSINGTALPFPSGPSESVTSGALTLDPDTHAWTMEQQRSSAGQPATITTLSGGSYTLSGSILALTIPMGGSLAGSYAVQTITVYQNDWTLLFTRR